MGTPSNHLHLRGLPVGGQPAPAHQYYFQPTVSCPNCGLQQTLGTFYSQHPEAEVYFTASPYLNSSNSARFEVRTTEGTINYFEHFCTGISNNSASNAVYQLESYMQRIDQRLEQLQQQNERKDAEIKRLHQRIEIMRMAHADQLASLQASQSTSSGVSDTCAPFSPPLPSS